MLFASKCDADLEALLRENDDEIEENQDLSGLLTAKNNDQRTNITDENIAMKLLKDFQDALEKSIGIDKVTEETSIVFHTTSTASTDELVECELNTREINNEKYFIDFKQKYSQFINGGNRNIVSTFSNIPSSSSNASNNKSDISLTSYDVSLVTSQLQRHASYKQTGPGISMCMCVYEGICTLIGTSRGFVLLFDKHDDLQQIIGSAVTSNTRCDAAVTALDFNSISTIIISGHASGDVVLWDSAKGTQLKRIQDLHHLHITNIKFLPTIGYQNKNTSSFSFISCDSKGITFRTKITRKSLLFASYSHEPDCLLNGGTGTVLDVACLKPCPGYGSDVQPASYSSISSVFSTPSKLTDSSLRSPRSLGSAQSRPLADMTASFIPSTWSIIAVSTSSRTYIIQFDEDSQVVCFKWPLSAIQPSSNGNGDHAAMSVLAVSLDWEWGIQANEVPFNGYNHDPLARYPSLVRAHGNTGQILHIYPDSSSLSTGDQGDTGREGTPLKTDSRQFRYVRAYNTSLQSSNILAVRWLGPARVIALTADRVHLLSHHLEPLASYALSSALDLESALISSMQNSSTAVTTGVGNRIAARRNSLLLLTPDALGCVHVLSLKDKVDGLIQENRWLEALSLIPSTYTPTDRVREVNAGDQDNDEVLDSDDVDAYILKYIDIALSPNFTSHHASSSSSRRTARNTRTYCTEHNRSVSKVCVEFCLLSKRISLLYGSVFDRHASLGLEQLFFDALEPYILSQPGLLLPCSNVSKMATAYHSSLQYESFERCLLHMGEFTHDGHSDCNLADEMERHLSDHHLIAGYLFYICVHRGKLVEAVQGAFNRILLPLFIASLRYTSSHYTTGAGDTGDILHLATEKQADLGYRILLFLGQCETGQVVYPHDVTVQVTTSDLARIIKVLLRKEKFPISSISQADRTAPAVDSLANIIFTHDMADDTSGAWFPCLTLLSRVDTLVSLDIMLKLLKKLLTSLPLGSDGGEREEALGLYFIMFEFVAYLDTLPTVVRSDRFADLFYDDCIGDLMRMSCDHPFPPYMVTSTIRYLLRSSDMTGRCQAEDKVALFVRHQAQYRSLWGCLREVLVEKQCWIALFSLKDRREFVYDSALIERCIAYHLAAENSSVCLFTYLDALLKSAREDRLPSRALSSGVHSVILGHMVRLNQLDTAALHQLVYEYMLDQASLVIAQLRDDPWAQYMMIDRIVTHLRSDPTKTATLSEVLSQEDVLLYIKLMIEYEPSKVLAFVSSTSDFPLDECISLCRSERAVYDALIYLLERAGQLEEALEVAHGALLTLIEQCRGEIELKLKLHHNGMTAKSSSQGPGNSHDTILAWTSTIQQNQNDTLRRHALEELPSFTPLLSLLPLIAKLCLAAQEPNLDPSLWYQSFDFILAERGKAVY